MIVVDVLVQHPDGIGVVPGGHRGAETQIGDGGGDLRLDRVPISAVDERENDIVHHPGVVADLLRSSERQVHDGEFTLGEDRALRPFVEEVIGRDAQPAVGERVPACHREDPLDRKTAVVGELGLEDRGRLVGRIIRGVRGITYPDVVDGIGGAEGHSHQTRRNQHRLGSADAAGVDLTVDHQAFGRRTHRPRILDLGDRPRQRPLLCERSRAQCDAKVVHPERGEARVVGLTSPFGGAPESRVHPGTDGQHQGDRHHRHPTRSEITP